MEDSDASQLTPRQRQIIAAIRQGHRNKTIAHLLQISEGTVKVHVRHIMRRLKVGTRTAIAMHDV